MIRIRDEYVALLRMHGDIGRSVQGTTVNLKPLSANDLRTLTESLAPWCQTDGERDRLARRLVAETGGSPFLAVTLLGALDRVASLRPDVLTWPAPEATFDSPLPLSVPRLARAALVARVAQLDPDVRRVAATASVLAIGLDPELIAELLDRSRAWVEERLSHLERASLITFDGVRYAFAASLIAQVVRSEFLTPGQRRAVKSDAIAALASRSDIESRVLRAELLAEIAPNRESFREAAAAARDALKDGATRTARRAVVAAERAVDGLGDDERADLAHLRSEIATRPGNRGGKP